MRISLFFPAYNEEDNIAVAVDEAERVLRTVTTAYEIIIVNDGSKDKTGAIADVLALEKPNVKVIHHDPNQGYGAALWSGIQAAKYEWVFFTDADLQFRLDEIRNLIKYAPRYDVILGYRAPRKDPVIRLINAKGWNVLNQIFFGLKVRDIDCAFKLFRRDLVANLPLKTRGATMSAEMLIRLQRLGIEFKEVPVTHLPRLKGEATGAKPAVIIRAFKELFGLWRGDLGKVDTPYIQAGKFGLVGLVNTAVDVGLYYLFTRYILFFAENILTAKFLTFFLGTICSFILNRQYTFAVKEKLSFAQIAKFYSSIAVTLVANVAALYFFNIVMGIHDLLAVGIATVASFIIGFALSKLWVFRSKIAAPIKQTWHGINKLRPDKIDWSEVARASNDL